MSVDNSWYFSVLSPATVKTPSRRTSIWTSIWGFEEEEIQLKLVYACLTVKRREVKCNFSDVYICITLNWSDRPEDIDTMKEDTQRGESFQNKRGDKYVLFVSTSTWLAWPEDIYIKEEWKEIAVVFRFKKMIISWWPQIIMPTRWKYISAYVPSKTGLRWEYGGCLHFQTEVFCLHFPAQLDLKIFIERWNKKMIISRAGCTDNKVKIFWCLITEDSEFS